MQALQPSLPELLSPEPAPKLSSQPAPVLPSPSPPELLEKLLDALWMSEPMAEGEAPVMGPVLPGAAELAFALAASPSFSVLPWLVSASEAERSV